MSTELWQQARELFAGVVELPAEQWVDALHSRSADNAELRAAAAQLLEKHEERSAGPALFAQGETVAGRFRVRRLLGRGGMGEVYLCDDVELGQPIALKALRAACADAAVRFRREIQLARRVTHPNVCRVFELGRHESSSGPVDYYTMEYVDGETLAELLARNGRLSPEEAGPLIVQIAAGLGALHEREIVHRDLKPGNILLERRRQGEIRVVLTDLGIAGATGRHADESLSTLGGQIFGTPEYMAPEQLSGLAAGPPADIFALGAVFYEMVAGVRPFPEGHKRFERPISPRVYTPEIPCSWDLLIQDCLRADIAGRPQSADEVVDALGGAYRQRPPDRTTAATIALARPSPARRPWRWALSAVCVAVLAALGLRFSHPVEATAERVRIAVLPFSAVTAEPELQALADGLTDTVTGRLSQYGPLNAELLVVPSSEVRRSGAMRADTARGVLGASLAVEGRLSHQGDRIRLTLTLIDAEKMLQRETAVIDGARSQPLELEDRAVARLAALLNLQALPTQVESIATALPGAQELYLRGKGYLQRSRSEASIDSAIQLFERSIQLDERYAMSYAGLCDAYLSRRRRSQDPVWLAKADEASRRGVELRPDLLVTQIARGDALAALGRFQDAASFFQAALELNPRSTEAFAGLGAAYEQMAADATEPAARESFRRQAEIAFRQAISLRPDDWVAYRRLAAFYRRVGRYQDAIRQYRIVAELAPNSVGALVNLGLTSLLINEDENAAIYLRKALALDPNRPAAIRTLAPLESAAGNHEEAARLYRKAVELNPNDAAAWGNLAAAYRRLARYEEADEADRKSMALSKHEGPRQAPPAPAADAPTAALREAQALGGLP